MSVEASKLFGAEGLVAVITGGGSGIGLMMAQALATNGAKKVYLLARRKDVLDAAVKEGPEGVFVAVTCDVTSKESLKAAVDEIKNDIGYINLLVCNSGVLGPGHHLKLKDISSPTIEQLQDSVMESSMEEFTAALNVNITGIYYTAFAFLDLLDKGNKKGNLPKAIQSQIIATSSVAAFSRSMGQGVPYHVSKSSTVHMVKILSKYFIPYNIRVNSIAPGFFPTDLARATGSIEDDAANQKIPQSMIPAARFGDESDMAGMILYLASRAGAYCNGSILLVDGGRMCNLPGSY